MNSTTNSPIFGHTWEEIQALQQGKSISKPLKPMAGRITPSQYEKNEWSRMAQDAYAKDLNDIGHKFSMAATLNKGEDCSLAWFDALQTEYRAWLTGGFNKA